MPSHADWLKDLSLMPPVSVTMQARKLELPAGVDAGAAAEVPGAAAEVGLPPAPEVFEPPPLDLLPQPASTSATAATPAIAAPARERNTLYILSNTATVGRAIF